MPLTKYTDVPAFHDRVIGFLNEREIHNNLPIGILQRGKDERPEGWWMTVQTDASGDIQLVSLRTPPQNLLLCEGSRPVGEDVLTELTDSLLREDALPRGVLAEKSLAERFSRTFCQMTDKRSDAYKEERIYRLDTVNDVPLVGTIRPASEKDMFFMPYWTTAMMHDFGMTDTTLDSRVERARYYLDDNNEYAVFFLEVDGIPVSMAALSRTLPNGRAVSGVYTPPYYRGKGYATSCVAQVSGAALKMGYSYCTLFTDLANPTSNSIYQKIGYRPVCDCTDIRFT